MSDRFRLSRFVEAQDPVIAVVLEELRQGQKRSHWMWFVFPQIAGLGHSATARHYAISSIEEARAYLQHPTLGPRLRQCTETVIAVEGRSVHQIFESPDDLKFHSSMTLFATAQSGISVFRDALGRYFQNEVDRPTMEKLAQL